MSDSSDAVDEPDVRLVDQFIEQIREFVPEGTDLDSYIFVFTTGDEVGIGSSATGQSPKDALAVASEAEDMAEEFRQVYSNVRNTGGEGHPPTDRRGFQ